MAIAFDAFSAAPTTLTGSGSWTHTPVGTPKGVLVFVVQNASGVDNISSVTYGGVAMQELAASPRLHPTGEPGAVFGYFLGAGIPTGPQTVAVTVSAGVNPKRAVAYSMTAGNNTAVEASAAMDSDSQADPQVILATGSGVPTFVAGALHSGHASPISVIRPDENTADAEHDFGQQVCEFNHLTALGGGGNITFRFFQAAEDAVLLAAAIREVAGATIINLGQPVENETGPAVTPLRAATAGLVTEAEVSQGLSIQAILAPVSQSVETETAQAVATPRTVLLGQSAETETTQLVTAPEDVALGQVVEGETSLEVIGGGIGIPLGRAFEMEFTGGLTCRGDTIVPLGQVTEPETSRPVTVVADVTFGSFQNIGSFGATSPRVDSFTPVGVPRGIVVTIVTNSSADQVTGVTYGGVAMQQVANFASSHGTADGRLHLYFLGANIPVGTQNVSISCTGGVANKFGGIYEINATDNTIVAAVNSAQGTGAQARQLVLATPPGINTFVLNAVHTAEDVITDTPPSVGHTVGVRNDFGTETWGTFYMTAIQTGGSITTSAGGTGDTWAMVGLAIREALDVTAVLAQPSELESSQTITAVPTLGVPLGQPSETETSQLFTAPETVTLGQPSESESSQVFTHPIATLGGWVTRPSSVAGAGFQNCGAFAPTGVGHNWYAVSGGDVSRVHVTTDGINWLPSKFGFPEFSSQIGGLEGSRTVANRVWALTGNQSGTGSGRLMRGTYSPSGGTITWTEIATLADGPATGGASHPRQLGRLLALDEANDVAFCATIDGIWMVTLSTGAMVRRALAGTDVTGILLDPANSNIAWATADGGTSPGFHRIANIRTGSVAITSNTTLGDAQDLAFVDDGTRYVWVAAGTGGVRRWTVGADGSAGWSNFTAGYNDGGNNPSAIDAVVVGGNVRVAVMNAGNANCTNAGAVSNNGGVTWNNEAGGWTVNDSVLGYNQQFWLTASDPFFLLSNSGWDSCVVRFDPANPNILMTWGRSGNWRSTDGGTVWRPSIKGIGGTVSWGVNPAPSGDDGYALDGDWGPLLNLDQFTTMPSREKPGGNVGTGMGGAFRPDNLRVALAMGDWSNSTNGEIFTSDPPYTTYTDNGFSAVPDDRNRCGVAIGENAAGQQVLLTVADGTGIQRKVGSGTPTTVSTGVTNGFYSLAKFWWPNGHTGTQPIVYLSASNGLWRSDDYGANWSRILTYTNSSEYTGRIYGLPANPVNTLFLTIDGSISGLYKVTNASTTPTLTQVKGAAFPGPCVVDSSGFVFFAVTANEAGGNKLFRSDTTNPGSGATFTDISDAVWKGGATFPSDMGIWANGSLFVSDKQGGYFVVDRAVGATVLGEPQETETAPTMLVIKTENVSQAVETEQAPTFGGGSSFSAGQATEAETSPPFLPVMVVPLGQPTEAEAALVFAGGQPNGPKMHFTIRMPVYKFRPPGYQTQWRVDGEEIP